VCLQNSYLRKKSEIKPFLSKGAGVGRKLHWTCAWKIPADHGLRTPNEGINESYLKNWADVADKLCFGRTKQFGIGIEFSAAQ
jgi:hypothetical protein